ncbi:MAG: phosphate ABC transporter substrate-binding protein PstS [Candidatus Symbiobacter sp.]|nr:phosphate ABC transporter substrate-binding protein PstS [Candidatus Symbiobacter sp.]
MSTRFFVPKFASNILCATMIALVSLATAPIAKAAADITGAGATFPFHAYSRWAEAYKTFAAVGLKYQPVGSSGGLKQIAAKAVDFAASDIPQTLEWQDQNAVLQFPIIIGGIVPAINVNGIKSGEMKLTGAVLADIFMGKIINWGDNRIRKLNPNLVLPNQPIKVLFRNDGSGTSYNFSDYLAKKSPEWRDKIGVGSTLSWPTGIGAKGNDGIATLIKRVPGAIGYVDYAYVIDEGLDYALVENRDGLYPKPNLASYEAAAANANWDKAPGFRMTLTDQAGAKSWPITAVSFVLMQRDQTNMDRGLTALKFFSWAMRNGQKIAHDLDYAALPMAVVSKVEENWQANLTSGGKPLWPPK